MEEYTIDDVINMLLDKVGNHGLKIYGDGSGSLTEVWFDDDDTVRFDSRDGFIAWLRGEPHQDYRWVEERDNV